MGKASRKKREANPEAENVKKYSLSADERAEFKRILSTMGFFNTALEGLNLRLQVKQAEVQQARNIGKAPEGYTLQTKIDMEDGFLMVRKVKLPPAPAPEAKKEAKK